MKNRKKPVLLAAVVLSTVIATSAIALRWTGDVRRAEALQELITDLETAREAAPLLREAPYGETVEGSAWEHYALALECVKAIDDHRDRCMAMMEAETSEERAAGRTLLSEAGDLFGHLKRGAHARDATRPFDWDANLSARLLRLTDSRAMGQLVTAHAYRLIAEGRSVEAAQAMLDMQQFAADTMMSPALIEEMIGCALVAPDRFTCTPAPGGPGLSQEGKRAWLNGVRKIRAALPGVGESYNGELELLARYLREPGDRTEQDWDDGSPGWRYGFSWEAAATEFALGVRERSPAYRAAMEDPNGLDTLGEMHEAIESEANPAASRCGVNLRSVAISRRTAFLRLYLLEHALAIETDVAPAAPTYPLAQPATVEVSEDLVRVGADEPNGHRVRFELFR